MADARCPVCGDRDCAPSIFGGTRYGGQRYTLMRCRTCGMRFVDPRPSPEQILAFYTDAEYFEHYRAPGADAQGYLASCDRPNDHDDATLAALGRVRTGGRLLDIGAAGGRFLCRAREAGYTVRGLEPNPQMAAYARDRLGLDVPTATLDDVETVFPGLRFDIVHLGDVLEHLRDLDVALSRVNTVLAPDGVLVLQQPLTYNASLYNAFLALNMWLKTDRYASFPPWHLWEFTPASLRRFLTDRGFVVRHFATFEAPLPADESADHRLKRRVGSLVKRASAVVSRAANGVGLELGDRGLVVCVREGAR